MRNPKGRLDILCSILTAANRRFGIARAYLSECLQFAKDHDGFDKDRIQRPRDPKDYAAWKGVHNELLVPYFFAKVFKLTIKFVTNASRGGLGDFLILLPTDRIVVEVKTPQGDILVKNQSEDDQQRGVDENLQDPGCSKVDERLLNRVFTDAAREVKPGNKNLVVVCTRLCKSIFDLRALEKLLYGHKKLSVTFDQEQGNTVETEFIANGHLIKHHGTRFTRISAVASFSEDVVFQLPVSGDQQQVHFAILHHYHAKCPIPPELFPGVEQFVAKGKGQSRTDQLRLRRFCDRSDVKSCNNHLLERNWRSMSSRCCMSGGRGASNLTISLVVGWRNSMLKACRAQRVMTGSSTACSASANCQG